MKTVNLEIYGFDSNSSKVFNYLLQNVGNYRSVTAKLISDNLDMPPKAVYQSLKQLEKEKLVEFQIIKKNSILLRSNSHLGSFALNEDQIFRNQEFSFNSQYPR